MTSCAPSKDWLPIESAPRDGSWFVIAFEDEADGYEVGHYDPLIFDEYEHAGGDLYRKLLKQLYDWRGFSNFHRATHWMPLPPRARGEQP